MNSSVENGLCFSEKMFNRLNEIKKFNYKYIYLSDKLKVSMDYFELILNTIYNFLKDLHSNRERAMRICSDLVLDFEDWISNYWSDKRSPENKNSVIFSTDDPKEWNSNEPITNSDEMVVGYRSLIYSGITEKGKALAAKVNNGE